MTARIVELERCTACRCHKPVGEDCGICPLLAPEEIAGVAAAIVRHGNA
jgi:hypothetical protein